MRHLIMTRLGLGVARRSEYRLRIALLENTLLPCLKAQTSDAFRWTILVDRMIDPDSEAELQALIADRPHFEIEKIDTFRQASLALPTAPLCERYFGTRNDVLLTRVDDDDAFAVDFVETLQRRAAEVEGLAAFSFVNGLLLDPAEDALVRHDGAGTSVGMSLRVPDAEAIDPYRLRHKATAERIVALGGTSVEVETEQPSWLQVLYSFSVSRETRGAEGFISRLITTRSAVEEEARAKLLAHFGLAADLSARLVQAVQDNPLTRQPLTTDAVPRLNLKREILRMVTEKKKLMGKDKALDKRLKIQIAALRESYYAL